MPHGRLVFLFTVPYCLVYEFSFHLLPPGMMIEVLKELLRGCQLGLEAPHSSWDFSVCLWFKHWQLLTPFEGKYLPCPLPGPACLLLLSLTSHPDSSLRPFLLLLITVAYELRTPKTTVLIAVIPSLLCLAVVFSNNPISFAYHFSAIPHFWSAVSTLIFQCC